MAVVVASMAIISMVVSATPVAIVPGIIAGPVIDHGSAIIIRPRVAIVGIAVIRAAVITGANPYAEPHSGIGLAGKAHHCQQRNY